MAHGVSVTLYHTHTQRAYKFTLVLIITYEIIKCASCDSFLMAKGKEREKSQCRTIKSKKKKKNKKTKQPLKMQNTNRPASKTC